MNLKVAKIDCGCSIDYEDNVVKCEKHKDLSDDEILDMAFDELIDKLESKYE